MEIEEIKSKLTKLVPGFARKVAPVYQLLGWEWEPERGNPHIPTTEEIERCLFDLIAGLNQEFRLDGTGGLTAYYTLPDEEDCGEYGIAFKLDETGYFDD